MKKLFLAGAMLLACLSSAPMLVSCGGDEKEEVDTRVKVTDAELVGYCWKGSLYSICFFPNNKYYRSELVMRSTYAYYKTESGTYKLDGYYVHFTPDEGNAYTHGLWYSNSVKSSLDYKEDVLIRGDIPQEIADKFK